MTGELSLVRCRQELTLGRPDELTRGSEHHRRPALDWPTTAGLLRNSPVGWPRADADRRPPGRAPARVPAAARPVPSFTGAAGRALASHRPAPAITSRACGGWGPPASRGSARRANAGDRRHDEPQAAGPRVAPRSRIRPKSSSGPTTPGTIEIQRSDPIAAGVAGTLSEPRTVPRRPSPRWRRRSPSRPARAGPAVLLRRPAARCRRLSRQPEHGPGQRWQRSGAGRAGRRG